VKSERVLWFLVACAVAQIALGIFLPRKVAADALANLDPVQIQMLLDAYREQVTLLKLGFGTVTTAETGAIVWLTNRLLAEMNRKKR